MKRWWKKAKERSVAIEIRRGWLHLAMLQPPGADGRIPVRTRSVRWQCQSNSLYSKSGVTELTNALKTLVEEEGLAGCHVHLSLNGDYCVTRVVTGTTERVRHELASLEQRSALYLSLGPGKKSSATSVRSIDARHEHALLTVTNGKIIHALVDVAKDVGLEVTLIEPSLVALCRALEHTGRHTQEPVVLLNLSENGVELGICHQGQLMLDYRPGGRFDVSEVADLLVRHLPRLDRYCQRYCDGVQGHLQRIVLCGSGQAIEAARVGFQNHQDLTVDILEPVDISRNWRFEEADPAPDFCGALGTCLRSAEPDVATAGPNLLAQVQATSSHSLGYQLCRALWPVAAVVLVALSMVAANWRQQMYSNDLNRQLQRLDSESMALHQLQMDIRRSEAKIKHFQTIADGAFCPPWSEVLLAVAQCLPEGVWLDKVTAEGNGEARLVGNSLDDEALFQLAGHLEPYPMMSQLVIEQTQAIEGSDGWVTRFNIQLKVDDQADCNEERSRDN